MNNPAIHIVAACRSPIGSLNGSLAAAPAHQLGATIIRSCIERAGIAATLVRGSECVTLGALLWFDGSSQSASDMDKRWIFAQGAHHSLDAWLEEHHSGGAKALKRLEKDTDGLLMHTSKNAYLAKLHSFFEVGANAFTLLNRAAGLKQLNSIDDILKIGKSHSSAMMSSSCLPFCCR